MFSPYLRQKSSYKPFPNDKFETLPNSKTLQTTILHWMKMVESSTKDRKHCGKRSNFSFFQSVFKRLALHTHKIQGLFGKELRVIKNVVCKCCQFGLVLTHSQTSPGFYVSAVLVFRKHCGKRRNCS